MHAALLIFRRDLLLAFRRPSDIANPIVFFLIVATMFPLAISPTGAELRDVGPGVLWVTALLASLLGMNSLFRTDFDDGSIEALLVGPAPLPLLVAGKIAAHWVVSGLPLVLLVPLIGVAFALPSEALPTLALALLLATPTIAVLVAIVAALTVGLKGAASIVGLLVLPLASPVLVFGTRATDLVLDGESPGGPLYLLASLAVLTLTLGPLVAAAAVRVAAE